MVDTDVTRPTMDDGRRTTSRVWYKLPTGELTRMKTFNDENVRVLTTDEPHSGGYINQYKSRPTSLRLNSRHRLPSLFKRLLRLFIERLKRAYSFSNAFTLWVYPLYVVGVN